MSEKIALRAARGEHVKETPVWMMRQAGRYLPEYHQTKEKAGGFLNLCKIPEYGIEVTLQPIRRFGFDAAILFSDILIPAEAMGIELEFNPGPVIGNPVETRADVDALEVPEPEESLGFVMEILRGLRSELPSQTTLIGFAGAPFTVACYMVGGSASRGQFEKMRGLVYRDPALARELISKITDTTIAYLRAQIEAGAEMVQLFDSSAGLLTPTSYLELAVEPARRIIQGLADTGTPVIYFAPGAMTSIGTMRDLGADVIGIDWRLGLGAARDILGDGIAVQGNLDPVNLLGTVESVRQGTARVLAENAGRPGHIFNLGHGVLPQTPIENVEAMVKTVRGGV